MMASISSFKAASFFSSSTSSAFAFSSSRRTYARFSSEAVFISLSLLPSALIASSFSALALLNCASAFSLASWSCSCGKGWPHVGQVSNFRKAACSCSKTFVFSSRHSLRSLSIFSSRVFISDSLYWMVRLLASMSFFSLYISPCTFESSLLFSPTFPSSACLYLFFKSSI